MTKILSFTLFILIGLIVIEVGLFFFSLPHKSIINQSANQTVNFNSQQLKKLSVTYKKGDDNEGRTIIYLENDYRFSGYGEFSIDTKNPGSTKPMIGLFKNWQTIENSKDRYLTLQDPITKKEFTKIRVSFEEFPIILKDGPGVTTLAVENLTENKVENPQKAFADLSNKQLDQLIQQDDALVIFPLVDNGVNIIYDDKHIPYAFWIILRRNDGLKNVDLPS